MAFRPKVVILGVDGADFAHYRRWIDKGLMPNFRKLSERGRMGILESTYPPVTAPAWISLMTGEQPGSHGIVGWAAPSARNGEYTRKVVNSGSVESPLMWEIVGGHGRSKVERAVHEYVHPAHRRRLEKHGRSLLNEFDACLRPTDVAPQNLSRHCRIGGSHRTEHSIAYAVAADVREGLP